MTVPVSKTIEEMLDEVRKEEHKMVMLQNIRAVMESLNISSHEAMEILDVSIEERECILGELKKLEREEVASDRIMERIRPLLKKMSSQRNREIE